MTELIFKKVKENQIVTLRNQDADPLRFRKSEYSAHDFLIRFQAHSIKIVKKIDHVQMRATSASSFWISSAVSMTASMSVCAANDGGTAYDLDRS